MLHDVMSRWFCYSANIGSAGLAVHAAVDAGNSLDSVLRSANQQLGAAGRRVAKFIDENRQIVLASSAAALGARIGTSDATVLRTVQTLGFASLAALKRAILNSATASTPADDILQAPAEGLGVLQSRKCRAQIAAAVGILDGADRIAVFGIGPSAALAN